MAMYRFTSSPYAMEEMGLSIPPATNENPCRGELKDAKH